MFEWHDIPDYRWAWSDHLGEGTMQDEITRTGETEQQWLERVWEQQSVTDVDHFAYLILDWREA